MEFDNKNTLIVGVATVLIVIAIIVGVVLTTMSNNKAAPGIIQQRVKSCLMIENQTIKDACLSRQGGGNS